MAAVAHNPQFAAKVGVPQSVGKDFNQADQQQSLSETISGKKKRRMGRLEAMTVNG